MSSPDLVIAAIDWPNVIVGAVVSAVAGLLFVVLFQRPLERAVFVVRRVLRLGGPSMMDGIWRSRYEYESSESPELLLSDEHFVVMRQDNERIKGTSLPRPGASELTLELKLDGAVITGTWREETSSQRHYHGACQLRVDPTSAAALGQWLGYSRSGEVRSGSWSFERVERKVTRSLKRQYSNRDDLAWRSPAPIVTAEPS